MKVLHEELFLNFYISLSVKKVNHEKEYAIVDLLYLKGDQEALVSDFD